MAPLPPPFPKAMPSLLGSDRQWEWATRKVKWEIKNLRGEVRDVTTTGEAGEKKENIIGECHACSSCTPEAVPGGDGCEWMAVLRLTARHGGAGGMRDDRERAKWKRRWGSSGGGWGSKERELKSIFWDAVETVNDHHRRWRAASVDINVLKERKKPLRWCWYI